MNENTPQELDPQADSAAPDEGSEDQFIEIVNDESLDDAADEAADTTEASIIEKLKAALDESEKRALIAAADLENFRKRSAKNTQDQIRYAALPLMSEMLEAVDNLNRAIESASDEGSNSGLLEGVKMVSGQILNVLKSNHCEPIPSVGETFDPNLHQAVQMQPSEDYPENTVMMEMRTGYRLHDRVIRPSQVFVSTGSKKSED